MSTGAVVMMVVYLSVVWGGLAFGAMVMYRNGDETAGSLPPGWVPDEGDAEPAADL